MEEDYLEGIKSSFHCCLSQVHVTFNLPNYLNIECAMHTSTSSVISSYSVLCTPQPVDVILHLYGGLWCAVLYHSTSNKVYKHSFHLV